jgi:hypothetical protein
MAKMLSNFTLRVAPDGARTEIGADAEDIVEVLEKKDGWLKVRLLGLPQRPEGWVRASTVDEGAVADTSINKDFFAKECILDALYVGVSAHFLMASAQIRSGITNGEKDGRIGPFGLKQAEWDAVRNDKEFELDFLPTQITEWRPQCTVAAVLTSRAQAKLTENGNTEKLPNAIELFQALWPDDKAKMPDDMQAALDATAEAIKAAAAKFEELPPVDPLASQAADSTPASPAAPASPTRPASPATPRPKVLIPDPVLPKATAPASPTTPKPKARTVSRTGDLFNDMAPRIMDDLMPAFALNVQQAAAILGNLGHECGGFKLLQEVKPLAGQGGFGWAQWTGPRRRKFFAFCSAKGLSPESYEGNLAYLKHELSDPKGEPKAIPAIKRPGLSLEAMVKAFELSFERAHPNFKHYESRNRWARKALAAHAAAQS